MKLISFFLLFNFCNTYASAEVEDEKFLKGIKDYAVKYYGDFFCYVAKGEDPTKKCTRVFIDKDPKTKKTLLDIRAGGTLPLFDELSKLVSKFSNMTNLFSDDPRRFYNVKTISITFTHKNLNRAVVCTVNDIYKCGYSTIGYCQDVVKKTGEMNYGYIVNPIESRFVYDNDLFLKCEDKRIEIDISRMPKKQQEYIKENPQFRPKPGAGLMR